MTWNYQQPVRIRFGNGLVNSLSDEVRAFGGHCGLLVTSASFARRGMVDHILSHTDGLIVAAYTSVAPNPDVSQCDACADLLRRHHCDFVVALGGGSVLDCAKAAATFCTADAPAADYLAARRPIPSTHLPLIAVPTTAGTGSEITCVSVLSDHTNGTKAPLAADSFYPALALVDPELTLTVPPHTTAATGMDVLCHAVEAFWSRFHQPVCDALALHAAALVLEWLPVACADGSDLTAREKMAEASVIAGLAFTIPKTTAPHACSYPLTNVLGIAHGEACGLTLAHFLRFNDAHQSDRPRALAAALGYADVAALATRIEQLRDTVGLRRDLRDLHLTAEQVEALVSGSKHPNLRNNPVDVTEQDLRDLYASLI